MKDLMLAGNSLFQRDAGNVNEGFRDTNVGFTFVRDLTGVKLPKDIEEKICLLRLLGTGCIEGIGARWVSYFLYDIPEDHEIFRVESK